jgi:t-SNARE complex subunit (syntaxin)
LVSARGCQAPRLPRQTGPVCGHTAGRGWVEWAFCAVTVIAGGKLYRATLPAGREASRRHRSSSWPPFRPWAPAMTNRLNELRGGLPHVDSVMSDGQGDVEGGLDPESERLMGRFNKEADAIRNVLSWARDSVADVDRSFEVGQSSASAERLADAGGKLDVVEDKLAAVRKRLKRIAGENKEFKRDHGNRTAVVRTRVVQYKQMGQQFIDVTKDVEAAREKHRDAMARSVRSDVMRANPALSAHEADAAMAAGDSGLESVMYANRADTAELRYQVADIQSRNKEIHKLTAQMAELHTMFTDMSILVDGQQECVKACSDTPRVIPPVAVDD